jgi:hypothetical protein
MTDKTLTWRDVPDFLGVPGWGLSAGYVVTKEPGDAPEVVVHALEINTGHQILKLSPLDFPNITDLESVISDEIDGEDFEAAYDLAHPEREGLGLFVDAMTKGLT